MSRGNISFMFTCPKDKHELILVPQTKELVEEWTEFSAPCRCALACFIYAWPYQVSNILTPYILL